MEKADEMDDTIPEFPIGKIVTVDRYNHIDDVERAEIKGYGVMPTSDRITYIFSIGDIKVETTGISIMESKFYVPAADEDRHEKKKKIWQK